MEIQRAANAEYKFEYGCNLRRLYPWKGVASPEWGSAIARVGIGHNTTLHSHSEKETFLILEGEGEISINGETEPINKGDVIYLPPLSEHTVKNTSDSELVFLTIWWDNQ